MPLATSFPDNPYTILAPDIRWYPGDDTLKENPYETLLPPLVYKVRQGVAKWRESGYEGASETSRALLRHWFESEHLLPRPDGSILPFSYYFAQREAVESIIWLYEVKKAKDAYELIRFDSSGRVSTGMFPEQWPRYVMKMATGSGKTKVISLLIAWSYFHRWYEVDSDLSSNILLIAPNIIVLERLFRDFEGMKIFFEDPVIPHNGYAGQNWYDDFQMTLHLQDEVRNVSDMGNIFLTNVHRLFLNTNEPSWDDDDVTDYFLGKRPVGSTTDSRTDLGEIIRNVSDLVVINDEAHHIHDPSMAWFSNISDIAGELQLRGSKLSAQLDVSATPKHNDGSIFVQTISDYPLVEAIRQGVVKTPVLPDEASRAKLEEHPSDVFTERYEDFLDLGYLEWKSVSDELEPTGKKSILFIMTDDTKNCDEVAEFLEQRYPDLRDAVLTIHTKNNGEISESASAKNKAELEQLRQLSNNIDDASNPYKAIVSVMMLREGWDVQNVVTVVGLRPFKAKSQILPEQALGRGLRRMFRGEDVREKVSVIGTQAFIDFVEQIKVEGVELEYGQMGGHRSPPKSPLVVEVERDSDEKDVEELDIELPLLSPRIYREYKELEELDITALAFQKVQFLEFTPEQQREIVFRDIDTGATSHTTVMGSDFEPNYQSVVAYFTNRIIRDLRLVGGRDVLFGKIRDFIADYLFDRPVDLESRNTLRNLSETATSRTLIEAVKQGINSLIVRDKGTAEIRGSIKLSNTRPYVATNNPYFKPNKSIFNRVVPTLGFEMKVARFLDGCEDIVSWAKNTAQVGFQIEYQAADGTIRLYTPDFLVKTSGDVVWVIETKGREDVDVPPKWERLQEWCRDASGQDLGYEYEPLFLREEDWEQYHPSTFLEVVKTFA